MKKLPAAVAELVLERATIDDAKSIYFLINEAYRGQNGWTRETEIVLGERSSFEAVLAIIQNANAHLMVVKVGGSLVACICIEEKDHQAYIGTFAVRPEVQNLGIGKKVLTLAEEFAVNQLGIINLVMVVISQREELIAFYERRGYRRTGEISEYPVHLNVGIPAEEGLTIECLAKSMQ